MAEVEVISNANNSCMSIKLTRESATVRLSKIVNKKAERRRKQKIGYYYAFEIK